jgi:tight adherence protein B
MKSRDTVAQFEKLLEIMSSNCSVPRNFMHSFEESLRSYVSVYENDVMTKAIESALMKISANSSSEDILNSFAKNMDIKEGYMFFENILLCEKKGGNISKTVRETASFIKEKIDIYYEIEVITAEKKTEQLIVSVMPFAVLALFMMSGTGYLDVMYTTDTGRIIMTAAGLLFLLSFYAAKKILEVKI